MKRGFTLIELLVVIAILAILATVIVVIINPGELLKQARDTTRISDLAAVNNAIALYLSDVTTPKLDGVSDCSNKIYCSANTGNAGPFVSGNCEVVASVTAVDGTGWASVNFNTISSGSPLARLPLDPQNTITNYYAYACGKSGTSALSYEIDAKMESTKYSAGGGGDVVSHVKDGGDNTTWYEVGSSRVQ